MAERTSRTSIDIDLDTPLEAMERRSWTSIREHAMRDWSQSQLTRASAPTAIGSKSQPAGGVPTPPRGEPIEAKVAGDYSDVERPMAFGYAAHTRYAERPAWDEDLELRLKEDWERTNPRIRADWEQVKPLVRHGWEYRKRMRS